MRYASGPALPLMNPWTTSQGLEAFLSARVSDGNISHCAAQCVMKQANAHLGDGAQMDETQILSHNCPAFPPIQLAMRSPSYTPKQYTPGRLGALGRGPSAALRSIESHLRLAKPGSPVDSHLEVCTKKSGRTPQFSPRDWVTPHAAPIDHPSWPLSISRRSATLGSKRSRRMTLMTHSW